MTSISTAISLDTMSFPLHGARLIEASAGTGKTFTITSLYLRLLLGDGCDTSRHQTELTVDQILVVTFTEVATAELRDRIRTRIHEARVAFSRGMTQDPILQSLLDRNKDHQQATRILLQAERQMDEAAIYTIHGFCQRMLTQNAFESGSRFNNEFITNENNLKLQVVADYWRCQFYSLPKEIVVEIRRLWSSPRALLDAIRCYLTGSSVQLLTDVSSHKLTDEFQLNLSRINELKQQWLLAQDNLEDCISKSDLHGLTKKALNNRLNRLNEWASNTEQGLNVPCDLNDFSQQALNAKSKKGNPPQHAIFDSIDEFFATPISLDASLLTHAITCCRAKLAEVKEKNQWLSFDDLLTKLSDAIDHDHQGLLTERIRSLYPIAMIDEFQDTDPLQYNIFSRIYLSSSECGLFMIGDPKQAIYAFRGADIFTYIKARRQVKAHYTLETNWRSSAMMVDAVNHLFSSSKSPFIYDNDIPFSTVKASPNAEKRQWYLNHQPQPALTYWAHEVVDKPISRKAYQQCMADATASKIQTILTLAQQKHAYFESQHRLIQANDIAVLVRTGREGRMVKEALAKQGIASVYLSSRDSVFASPLANDLQRLLQAVLEVENERILRASLASSLFGLNAGDIEALNNDEILWEETINEFKQYRQCWVERGILPMLRQVLNQRNIATRLLEEENGERLLTDFMHLGELLQQASQEIENMHGLLRWFVQSMSDAMLEFNNNEAQIQRLETERNTVQIITIHKSKGLEYKLVFLPFVMSYRLADTGKYYDEENDKTLLDIMNGKDAIHKADKERLAEDLRLMYVALTRAVYSCFVGVGAIAKGRSTSGVTGVDLSAMGYLLQDGEVMEANEFNKALHKKVAAPHTVTCEPPEKQESGFIPLEEKDAPLLTAKILRTPINRQWRMTSYSSLIRQTNLMKQGHQSSHFNKQSVEQHEYALETLNFDLDSASDKNEYSPHQTEHTIFTFPRGATPGTFLHNLFEKIEFTESADSEKNNKIITELMDSEQIDSHWLPVLRELVNNVLNTPLDGDCLRLNEKTAQERLVEMEFLLPIEALNISSLSQVIQQHDSLSAQAEALGFYHVQGMLKGFIDLLFVHQGKYYLLDWKSNHLGDQIECYQDANMKQAMIHHRYDLQYQIYALALHRYLRSRLANYDYHTHFGGVYYLFLRGMNGDPKQGVFSTKPSFELLDSIDRLIDGNTESSAMLTEYVEPNL